MGWEDARVAYNMFGNPFAWRKNADRTLTHQIETDEFGQAPDFLRQMYIAERWTIKPPDAR